jgi:hypothetical protein
MTVNRITAWHEHFFYRAACGGTNPDERKDGEPEPNSLSYASFPMKSICTSSPHHNPPSIDSMPQSRRGESQTKANHQIRATRW